MPKGIGYTGIKQQEAPSLAKKKSGRFRRFNNRLFDPGSLTDENIRGNREMADMLLGEASQTGPLRHKNQGYAQLMKALNAQIYRQRADKGEKALTGQRAKEMGDFLSAFESGEDGALKIAMGGMANNPALAAMVGPMLGQRYKVENREDTQAAAAEEAGLGRTHDETMQSNDQGFRGSESELGREHDVTLQGNAQGHDIAMQDDRQANAADVATTAFDRDEYQAQNERVFRSQMKSRQYLHEKEMLELETKAASKLAKEAKQNAGLDLTERQGKASAWALSYNSGNKYLTDQLNGTGDFEGRGNYVPTLQDSAIFAKSIDEKTGAVSREVLSRGLSDEAIEYFQSAYMMIDPVVRQRTGAAVREFEFITMVRTLIPLSNDTPQSLKQKEVSRNAAMEGIMLETGPGGGYLSQRYGLTLPGGQGGQGNQGGTVYDTQGNPIQSGGGF